MENQYDKLKRILREMFQMDQADLDFGIYRIMNQKRDEIEKFLDKDLLPQVKEEFTKLKDARVEEKRAELKELEEALRKAKVDPEENEEVKKLREEISSYGDEEALAAEAFSSLATFFRRYYDGGDFLSLRRYKKDTYAIPYEGEEVKLYWANADQFYIKSSEYLKDYIFKLDSGKRVHFKVVDATQEKDNVKEAQGKERRFKLYEEDPIKIDKDNLFINFVYLPDKEKQEKLNEKVIAFLTKKSAELKDYIDIFRKVRRGKDKQWTLLEKQLNAYTARFNFDFFIHKDLKGFLRRELDFFLKNEVLYIDDFDEQDIQKLKIAVAKAKAIKHIAHKIIDMLSQLEEFQKKLWLKKKFVTDCGYCITLDRIPEEFYAEIANNESQREDWVKLFAIDEIKKDLTTVAYSNPLTVEFLKENPYLVLDTKHFDEDFKERLLSDFDNIDESCEGVAINADNFQALNLLREKYYEKVKCVYIDPPYNTAASEIIYKNGYKHASWLSLMNDRLDISRDLIKQDGIIEIAIDDEEYFRLENIVRQVFGDQNYIANIAIMHNPKGRDKEHVASSHEYTILSAKNKKEASTFRLNLDSDKLDEKYPKKNEKGKYRELPLRRSGSEAQREDRPYMYYPFVYDSKKEKLALVSQEEREKIFDGSTFDDSYVEKLKDKYSKEGLDIILPIRDNGSCGRWRWGYEGSKQGIEEGTLFVKGTGDSRTVYQMDYEDATVLPKTFWYGERYDASTKGTNLLKDILGQNPFDYPKSIYAVEDMLSIGSSEEDLILDYFAGSGTTAHAVINLNNAGDKRRKYMLVEMGQHFDAVLKPRIQKAIYSKDWKNGKPVSREGSSHMFKYMKLESYEDTLDNLIVKRSGEQQIALDTFSQAKEGYMLHYWLDVETKGSDSLLNIDKFEDPFNYVMKIRQDSESKEQRIDLTETFNYLIGLYVEQTEIIRGFKAIRGKLRTGEKVLVIWRNTKEKSNDDLNEFFSKQGYNTLDFEFDRIYVNGDNNLENLRVDEDKWKVIMIEDELRKRMFDIQEI